MSEDQKKNAQAQAAVDVPKAPEAAKVPEFPFTPALESTMAPSVDFVSPTVHHTAPAGTPFSHVLKPEYWASCTKYLRTGCKIEVIPEDAGWLATLYVLRVGQGYAAVQKLTHIELDGARAQPQAPQGYEVQWRGSVIKHRVVRLKDGAVLKQGLDTLEEAHKWLSDHRRMMAA